LFRTGGGSVEFENLGVLSFFLKAPLLGQVHLHRPCLTDPRGKPRPGLDRWEFTWDTPAEIEAERQRFLERQGQEGSTTTA